MKVTMIGASGFVGTRLLGLLKEANAAMQFKNLTVNVDNVTFGGAKVTELNLFSGARNQFACMCYDNLPGLVVTDATHFPTFNFK